MNIMNASRNALSFALSVPAGILLLFKGISGPTETYRLLLEYLNSGIITDERVQSVILIAISSLGGLAVLAGGFLIWRNLASIGKLLIFLGAGVGTLWVVFLLITFVTTGEISSIISEYSLIGLIGLILAFSARLIAK
jgi:hypothetical protein